MNFENNKSSDVKVIVGNSGVPPVIGVFDSEAKGLSV